VKLKLMAKKYICYLFNVVNLRKVLFDVLFTCSIEYPNVGNYLAE